MTVTGQPGTRALHLEGIAHWFPAPRRSAAPLQALAGASLSIAPAEFVALVGPSGCGKTTLLRAAAGLLQPALGTVDVLGGTPADAAATRAVGLVAQEPGLLPWRSVAANVSLPLEVAGVRKDERAQRVASVLAATGMAAFAHYRPRQLSGGMRQRVALARALTLRPRLLLMDEPFGALDELSREELRAELLRLWERERCAVLFVTHSIREAVWLADRIVVMSERPGRVIADLEVALPRPRAAGVTGLYGNSRWDERLPGFDAEVARVRAALERGRTGASVAPGR